MDYAFANAEGTIIRETSPDGALRSIPVDPRNADYQRIVAAGITPSAYAAPVQRRLVPKSLIVERLQAAGKLAAASTALNADLYKRERWYAPDRPAIYADDPEALALLNAIGADPAVILAP
jgi:hypothetical protein